MKKSPTELAPSVSLCSHICNKSQRKKNIKAAADQVTKEEISNEVIKAKIALKKVEGGLAEINLRTGGKPALFTVRRGRAPKKAIIKNETILKAKVAAGLSNRQTKTVMQIIRTDTGKDGIEAGSQEYLIERNKKFIPYFNTHKVLMKVSRKEEVKERGEYCRDRIKTKGKGKTMVDSPTPLSYCNDVNSFFTELLNERGIENFLSLIVKIGIDFGRGKLKVNMSAIPKYQDLNVQEKAFLNKFKVKLQLLRKYHSK